MSKFFLLLNNLSSKGFFHLFLSNALIALSLFGAQILVAKWVSPSELGLIKSWQTYISILSVFAGLGLSASVLKVSANKETEYISCYFFTSLIVLVLGSILVWLFFMLLLNNMVFTNNDELLYYLNRYSFIVILIAVNALFFAHYTGQRKIIRISTINAFCRILSVFFILGLTYFFGVDGFFVSIFIGVGLTLSVYFFLSRRELVFSNFSLGVLKRYPTLNYSINGGIVCNGISQLVLGLDVLILNYFLVDGELIGYYSFSLLVVMGLNLFSGTVMQIVTPYITLNEGDASSLERKYMYYSNIAIISYVLVFFLAVFSIPVLVDWVFDGKYLSSEKFYFPMFLAWLVRSYSAMPIALLSGLGLMSETAKGIVLNLCVGLVSYYIGYVYFGVMGLAFSSIFPAVVCAFFYKYYVKKIFANKS